MAARAASTLLCACSNLESTLLQFSFSFTCYTSVDGSAMSRTSLASVTASRLTPFLGTNVRCPEAFATNLACILFTYREAYLRSKEALLSTTLLHRVSLTHTWGLFCPSLPRDTLTSSSSSTVSTSHTMEYTRIIFSTPRHRTCWWRRKRA